MSIAYSLHLSFDDGSRGVEIRFPCKETDDGHTRLNERSGKLMMATVLEGFKELALGLMETSRDISVGS